MDDERDARAIAAGGRAPASAEDGFDEAIYLRLNPDVRQALAAGAIGSAREHFEHHGRAEGRPYKLIDKAHRNRVILAGNAEAAARTKRAGAIESVRISETGGIFVIGWADDAADPLDSIDLYCGGWSVCFDAAALARSRRIDVESALGNVARHPHGFWGFLFAGRALGSGPCNAVIRLASGAEAAVAVAAQATSDHELRKIVLGYLATLSFYGNAQFAAATSLRGGIGGQLVALNRTIGRRLVARPYAQRFGSARPRYRGSLVVCLYGRPEYMFLQTAAFAREPGMADYEIIFVCNSPQFGEALLAEAKRCTLIYGIDLTVVILGGNAGVAAANNVAARHSRSDRLLFVNPDILPRPGCMARHSELVAALPAAQTDLFGAALYYDNGALAHGGMYFDIETVPDAAGSASLLSVVPYGHGAPAASAAARPVPAVSGALMSVSRPWFETLGGFTEDYIFGHYEDADFCLKSRARGRAAWLQDVSFWHLEGHGSTRLRQHDGGAIVNRWLFTHTWRESVARDLLGPDAAPAARTAGARV